MLFYVLPGNQLAQVQQPQMRVATGSMLTNGTCNSLPGWDPMTHAFNPISYQADADCRLNPMYGEHGLGGHANWGNGAP
ncbi:hypothetical protein T484DRAFT_1899140 [Baffinella frigidus]|nr:hypothetical protein T484DRAFT_1899140 [Cryptophyta sp. CCMP2293]